MAFSGLSSSSSPGTSLESCSLSGSSPVLDAAPLRKGYLQSQEVQGGEELPDMHQLLPSLVHILGDVKVPRRNRQPVKVPLTDSKGRTLSNAELKALRRRVTNRASSQRMRQLRASHVRQVRKEASGLVQDYQHVVKQNAILRSQLHRHQELLSAWTSEQLDKAFQPSANESSVHTDYVTTPVLAASDITMPMVKEMAALKAQMHPQDQLLDTMAVPEQLRLPDTAGHKLQPSCCHLQMGMPSVPSCQDGDDHLSSHWAAQDPDHAARHGMMHAAMLPGQYHPTPGCNYTHELQPHPWPPINQLDFAPVMLPILPIPETAGTMSSFQAAVPMTQPWHMLQSQPDVMGTFGAHAECLPEISSPNPLLRSGAEYAAQLLRCGGWAS